MDDLSGLEWSSSNTATPNIPPPTNTSSSYYPSLRPTPSPLGSGRNTPLSAQGSGSYASRPPPQKPAGQKPAQDSFSSLLSFGAAKNTANLSLKEQQERLQADKLKKEEEKRKQAQAHYGDGQYFETLGSNRSTPLQTSRTVSPAIAPPASSLPSRAAPTANKTNTDDDLFAAFDADTKVDNSSYYPPPESSKTSTPANAPPLNLASPSAWDLAPPKDNGAIGDDDDDPFGLNQLKPAARRPEPAAATSEDDDFLGDLAKPVEEVRRKYPTPALSREPEPGKAIEDSSSDSDDETPPPPPSDDPFDKAVAELVDYGFTVENARRGLTESGGGLNVQAAVNWLLDDAHRQAKAKQLGAKNASTRQDQERTSSQPRNGGVARTRQQDGSAVPNRGDNRSPASDVDFTKTAAAVGTTIFKTANSLWKTGQKKMQKAVAELQQEGGDPSQPKWMRDGQLDRAAADRKAHADATDEAMMLESGARPGRKPARPQPDGGRPASGASSRDQSPALSGAPPSRNNALPKWQQQPARSSPLDPRARLGRQAVEEESAQMYVSPARRKKTPQPPAEPPRPAEPEPDLLFNSSAIPKKPTTTLPQRPAQSSSPAPPQPSRSQRPPQPAPTPRPTRQVPPISAAALQTSTRHRVEGTAHFKRGDYAAAHTSYSTSLSAVPQTHPLAILLLCNRALTALKTGEPRQAVADADAALELIGPGKGEGESVDLDGASEKRDMRELYGKALTRKAEALEQMERWADAGAVWQACVEAGVGGHAAIAGRQRCQKALAPKPAAAAATPPPRPASARPRPAPAASRSETKKDSEAVARLRAAHHAAAREDGEKLALVDKVDARIAAWREGKRDNLRALLGSLDGVLWEGSGWKKVGLHELVMANKVKIVYMRAIAKTHPDKLPQDASTEVRMIAGTVFSTLNEAWDKFKAENGL